MLQGLKGSVVLSGIRYHLDPSQYHIDASLGLPITM